MLDVYTTHKKKKQEEKKTPTDTQRDSRKILEVIDMFITFTGVCICQNSSS